MIICWPHTKHSDVVALGYMQRKGKSEDDLKGMCILAWVGRHQVG